MDGRLRKIFRQHLPELAWSSIESGATEPGVPDSAYSLGWVEFKAIEHWAVPLHAVQVAWMARHTRAGGRVFIAVRRAENELWLINGKHASALKQHGLHGTPIAGIFKGGIAHWPWQEIKAILLK